MSVSHLFWALPLFNYGQILHRSCIIYDTLDNPIVLWSLLMLYHPTRYFLNFRLSININLCFQLANLRFFGFVNYGRVLSFDLFNGQILNMPAILLILD